jgi:hypothetical protein
MVTPQLSTPMGEKNFSTKSLQNYTKNSTLKQHTLLLHTPNATAKQKFLTSQSKIFVKCC